MSICLFIQLFEMDLAIFFETSCVYLFPHVLCPISIPDHQFDIFFGVTEVESNEAFTICWWCAWVCLDFSLSSSNLRIWHCLICKEEEGDSSINCTKEKEGITTLVGITTSFLSYLICPKRKDQWLVSILLVLINISFDNSNQVFVRGLW